ncbi:MAG: coproporphyrinogen III oxidase family protein [Treponema sp.]|nr:coproporphyrinogen III oxidase family protein [Treponema sp.]
MNCFNNASVYIHIPFCASLCDYCDFFSVKINDVNDGYIDSYLNALFTDINYQIEYFNIKNIPTVYIGGGTPSVLGKKIKKLFDALNKIPDFKPIEFSIEANPESITEDFLKLCKDGGVNRLSLGVQTFFEPSRVAVNRNPKRIITTEDTEGHGVINTKKIYSSVKLRVLRGKFSYYLKYKKQLELAAKYFQDNLSIDLITGLPFQDEKVIIDDIKKVLEYKPAHISLYSLSVEDGTPLQKKIKKGSVSLPNEDKADSLWLTSRDTLINAGFEQYEVSNFAIDSKKCLHNMNYWLMNNWIGAGASASGTIIDENTKTARRFTYNKDIKKYINNPSLHSANLIELDTKTLIKDCILMGYRCKEGLDNELFCQRFGCSIADYIPKTLERWKNKDKMLFLNSFIKNAFAELDEKSH